MRIGPSGQGWLKRLLPLISTYRRTIVVAVVAALVSMSATAATPALVAATVDRAVVGGESQVKWLGLLAGLAILRFIVGFALRYASNMVSLGLEFDLRTLLFEHLQSLDLATHDSIQTGQLVSRANADVRILQMFLSWMPVLWSGVLILPIAVVLMASWH
ncbi:MAG: ABC transporter transmembrane domain-containing protein, partial [Acidimicrobiia bacterium]